MDAQSTGWHTLDDHDFDEDSSPPRRVTNPPRKFTRHPEGTDPVKLLAEWIAENRVPKGSRVQKWPMRGEIDAGYQPIAEIQIGTSYAHGLYLILAPKVGGI